MANKKFSEFELKTDQAQVDFLVGYTGTENVQIASEKVGLRYDLLSGQSAANPLNYEFRLEDNAGGGIDKVTLVAGDNVVLTNLSAVPNVGAVKIDTKRGSVYTVTGTLQNMFGGDPGIFGDTVEFGISSAPAADHSSVLIIPVAAKIIGISYKWISNTAVTGIPAGGVYRIQLFPMTNTSGATTNTASYGASQPINGLDLTDADNGTFPFKTQNAISPPISVAAGTIINVSGVEVTGVIPTSNSEMEITLTFETTTF
jgi:hypothetical protein|tara:strand:+ start:3661 stop:4434 length:774 start_codon:yes stop_codon:yes gene_type:complete